MLHLPSSLLSLCAILGNTDSALKRRAKLPGGRNPLEGMPGHHLDPEPGESGPQTQQEKGCSPYITVGRGSVDSTWTCGPSESA